MQLEGIYFFHIPKTAGMSTWRYLDQVFAPERICPWWLWDQLITVPRPELAQWDVFRGHFQSHLEGYLRRPLKVITMLRDPLERTISHYAHVRRAPDHPYHRHAASMSLREFCTHPETRNMVENYQSAFLAKAPADPQRFAKSLGPESLARFELQEKMHAPDYLNEPAMLFDLAMQKLETCEAVGITEDFESSLRTFSHRLGWPPPEAFPSINVNPEKTAMSQIDEQTKETIDELTQVDRRLYAAVRTRSGFSGAANDAYQDFPICVG